MKHRSEISEERIKKIKGKAIANRRCIQLIELQAVKPKVVSCGPRPVKKSRQESDEIVELQNAVKSQAFVQFIHHASDVLERYQNHLNRNVESDPNTSKRCAELEFHNEDLQKKCKYMSSKIKSLESIIKQGNLNGQEVPQPQSQPQHFMNIEAPTEREIELSIDPMVAATDSDFSDTKAKLPTTFSCDYCNHLFARKFNLKTHMSTCKEKIALLPKKKAEKHAMVCEICGKKMPNRRKLLIHLWSIIRDWDKRMPRGKHGEMSREQHQEYRQNILRH